MIRKIAAATVIAAASLTGFAGIAHAEGTNTPSTTKAPNPLKCVGAADHKAAQAFRLQALNSELSALNARLAVAQGANNAKAVARIQEHITKVTGRIAEVQSNQAKVAAKCPA